MKLTLAAGKLLSQKTDALIVGIYRGKLTKSAEAVDKAWNRWHLSELSRNCG